jgi:hypothetical protein
LLNVNARDHKSHFSVGVQSLPCLELSADDLSWVLSIIDSIVEIKLGSKGPLTLDDARATRIGCNLIAPGVVSKLADESLQVPDQDNFS